MTLRCRELAFSYSASEVLIPPFSGEFRTGGITAVVGANGCGKSTLLKLLSGVLTPLSGSVEWEGRALFRIPLKERARRIALMSQTPEIPRDITVEEFLMYGRFPCRSTPRENRSAVEKLLQECGIASLRRNFLPELSGGERQKVFLAFSLIKEPEILLLDEPISALDPAAGKQFAGLLKDLSLRRACTVIVVLHDLAFAQKIADDLLGMQRGKEPFFLSAGGAKEELSALYAPPSAVGATGADEALCIRQTSGEADDHQSGQHQRNPDDFRS